MKKNYTYPACNTVEFIEDLDRDFRITRKRRNGVLIFTLETCDVSLPGNGGGLLDNAPAEVLSTRDNLGDIRYDYINALTSYTLEKAGL